MAAAAVFSNDVVEWDMEAGLREQLPLRRRPLQAKGDNRPTMVNVVELRTDWLAAALKRLSQFATLKEDWDSYGAPAPNQIAIALAHKILEALAEVDSNPPTIDPSAEGGICLSFRFGDRYGDIECLNSGEVLAAISNGGTGTEVWQIGDFEHALRCALDRIQSFVKSPIRQAAQEYSEGDRPDLLEMHYREPLILIDPDQELLAPLER